MLKKQQYFLAASIFSAPFQRPIYFVKYEADTLPKNKKQKTKKSIFYKLNIPSIMKFYRFYFLFFHYGWNLKIIKISKKKLFNYLLLSLPENRRKATDLPTEFFRQ